MYISIRHQNLEDECQQKEKREKARWEDLKLQKELEKVVGLWTTNEEVEEGLAKLVTTPRNANKVKLEAIKTQIHHRKISLGSEISDQVRYWRLISI